MERWTEQEIEERLRHGCFLNGDPGKDLPFVLIDPDVKGAESVPPIPVELVGRLFAKGLLQPHPKPGHLINYRFKEQEGHQSQAG